jgi:hypothetical protein
VSRLRGGGGGSGKFVGEGRPNIESLVLLCTFELGEKTPAALVGVFVCEVFVEASVEE